MKKFKGIALALTFIFAFVTCAEATGMLKISQEAYAKPKNKKVASTKKTKKVSAKKVAPKKKTTKKVATKKAAPKKKAIRKKATKKVSAKKAAPKKKTTKKVATKKATSKKKTTKKVSAKKATKAKRKTTSKKVTPKKVTSKKRPTTKKAKVAKKPVSKKSKTSKKSRSQSSRGTYSAQARVLQYANSYLGVPYVFGAASGSSFDCSGFTMYVYKKIGISLPHSASGQSSCGTRVSKSELMPGDLVFFHTYTEGISHVGIYIGNGRFIHASSGAGRVTTTSLSDAYYASRYRGATRLLQ